MLSYIIRISCFASSVALIHMPASAQDRSCPGSNYTRGFDGCLHRTPPAVLKGCKERRNECIDRSGSSDQQQRPVVYSTATPSQVANAIVCDIADAARATAGRPVDLKRAVITADITFTLVKKSSAGASLAVGAIPVFSAATVAPSLEASRITSETDTTKNSIKVDPAPLSPCPHASPNRWLTSNVILDVPEHTV